jgi:pyruvate dehydrogenase E1 component beta subunit
MARMHMVGALNMALDQEMSRDPSVVVLGEDVGVDGGVFRVTDGLIDKYGPGRVMDTPLAELSIASVSIGMAVYGVKPVAEIQFDGFSLSTLDPMINHAARVRNRTRGRFHCPMVLRFPYGGGIKALEHHSDSPETYFSHAPGLTVVIPSSPYEAKGLMISSIRNPDPVVFMEPKRIYRAIKEEVPEEEYEIPLGKANVLEEGSDVTIVAYGSMIRECKRAMENSSTSIELVDLRTISPMDFDTIEASVKKTGRCVIVHEAPKSLGIGAEISAMINEKLLLNLRAPVQRVTGYDIIFPLPKMEHYYLPDPKRISKAIDKVMQF